MQRFPALIVRCAIGGLFALTLWAGPQTAQTLESESGEFFEEGQTGGGGALAPDNLLLAQAGAPGGAGGAGQPVATALRGFAETPWRTTFTEVKARLRNLATSAAAVERVEVLNEVRNEYILVKRNDILYRYSFYKTPFEVQRIANHRLTREEWDQEEAVFFHVKVITPFIDAKLINERLENIYGQRTSTTVDEKTQRGANVWQLDGGLVFQWYEPYRQKPFTRTLDYLSREMAEQIMREYANYFDSEERILLRDMLLQ